MLRFHGGGGGWWACVMEDRLGRGEEYEVENERKRAGGAFTEEGVREEEGTGKGRGGGEKVRAKLGGRCSPSVELISRVQ